MHKIYCIQICKGYHYFLFPGVKRPKCTSFIVVDFHFFPACFQCSSTYIVKAYFDCCVQSHNKTFKVIRPFHCSTYMRSAAAQQWQWNMSSEKGCKIMFQESVKTSAVWLLSMRSEHDTMNLLWSRRDYFTLPREENGKHAKFDCNWSLCLTIETLVLSCLTFLLDFGS